MAEGKPGRPSKGERRHITVRVPREHWTIFDERARDLGYDSLSDYALTLLAKDAGVPVPAYVLHAMRHPAEQPSLLPRRLQRAS